MSLWSLLTALNSNGNKRKTKTILKAFQKHHIPKEDDICFRVALMGKKARKNKDFFTDSQIVG